MFRSANRIAERIEEAVREVATLFIALAPLDVILGGGATHGYRDGLIFIAIGVFLFIVVLITEDRRSNE